MATVPVMKRYTNRSGDSGVVAYATGPGSIAVQFVGGAVYLSIMKDAKLLKRPWRLAQRWVM